MDLNRRLNCLATCLAFVAWGCSEHPGNDYKAYSPTDTEQAPEVTVRDASPDPSTSAAPGGQTTETVATASVPRTAEPEPVAASESTPVPGASTSADETVAADPPAESPGDPRNGSDPSQDETLIATVGATDAATPGPPREIKVLIPEKSFQVEGPEGALRVSYDDLDLLKVLNMEPVRADAPEFMPQWLKDLEGKRIRIRGYMRPGELSEDLPFFVLARDTQACCFGPNTKAYDIIPVIMRQGVTTDYIHLQPFDLVGVFHINVEMDLDDPNKVEFLYYIDDAVVIQN